MRGLWSLHRVLRVRSIDVRGFDDEQIFAQLAALSSGFPEASAGVSAYAGVAAGMSTIPAELDGRIGLRPGRKTWERASWP